MRVTAALSDGTFQAIVLGLFAAAFLLFAYDVWGKP